MRAIFSTRHWSNGWIMPTPAYSKITPPLRGSRQDKDESPQPSRWGDKQQACLKLTGDFIDDAIDLYQTMSGETWE